MKSSPEPAKDAGMESDFAEDVPSDDGFDFDRDHPAKQKGHSCYREISKAKKESRIQLQELVAKHKRERADWERMMKDQTRAIHENYEREYSRASKNYQTQIEQMREVYTSQITQILQVLKNAVDSQILTARESTARQPADRGQMDELKKWMVDEFASKMSKYREIMDGVEADEANKKALASGQGIEIETRGTKNGSKKNNASTGDMQRLADLIAQRKSHSAETVADREPGLDLYDIEELDFRSDRSVQRQAGPVKKGGGGFSAFFRGLGNT